MKTVGLDGADNVIRNCRAMEGRFKERAVTAAREVAAYLEGWAKTHHLWVRQSGMTDATTRGSLETIAPDIVTLVLSAGMEYDVYLELAHGGRYKWLRPAVEDNRDAIREIVKRHMGVL